MSYPQNRLHTHMKKLLYTLALSLIVSAALAQQPTNAGFEDWDTLGSINGTRLYLPMHWQTTNAEALSVNLPQPVTYTTDAHTGNYAIKISTVLDETDQQMGMVFSGYGFSAMDDAGDKFALTGTPKKFGAWFKYFPEGQDSFTVMMLFFQQGQILGSAYVRSAAPTDTYTKIEQSIQFNPGTPTPDSAKVLIIPGQDVPFSKTYLIIDDVFVTYETTGLNEQVSEKIGVYPNPAATQLALTLPANQILTEVTMSDMQGKMHVMQVNEQKQINIAALLPGIYTLHGTAKNGQQYHARFVKE